MTRNYAAALQDDAPQVMNIMLKTGLTSEILSGAKAAVERAMAGAKAAGAKRALPLAVSIAAHSPLMS